MHNTYNFTKVQPLHILYRLQGGWFSSLLFSPCGTARTRTVQRIWERESEREREGEGEREREGDKNRDREKGRESTSSSVS